MGSELLKKDSCPFKILRDNYNKVINLTPKGAAAVQQKHTWTGAPLRWKVTFWFSAIMLLMALSLGGAVFMGRTTFSALERVQRSHVVYYEMQEALEKERRAFETCVREFSGENLTEYQNACEATRKAMEAVPVGYEAIGRERYARTWNILQGYAGYCGYRDALMASDPNDPGYVEQMYRVMEMQEYLEEYALMLVQATIAQNNESYRIHDLLYDAMPWIYLILAAATLGVMGLVIQSFSGSIVEPLLVLAQASRKMEESDFSGEDLAVQSQDELGQLTTAFNRMKRAMGGYIATLEEKNRIAQQLYGEEMNRVALQRDLDNTRLEMLRSQVDPHFLFNTLNMISCMARLEDASTTDRMILSLSGIFRYNLRTKAQEVWLEEELKVLEDYLYLQHMRFDGRMACRMDLKVDPARVRIPSFTLQPVVENAFRHGLKDLESGGRILLRIWQTKAGVQVSIADNGKGMTDEELKDLYRRIEECEETGHGIGLGNISRRIRMLYGDAGDFRIHTRPGRGTVIRMTIPQKPDAAQEGEDR